MDRDLPQHDESILRQMCSLINGEPLPGKLVDKYWSNKLVADRGGFPIRSEFIRICVECGFGKPTNREANPTVVDLWRQKKAKAGDAVVVDWRGKKANGTLVTVTVMNQIRVLLDNDPDEKQVEVGQVTLATAA